MHPKVEHRFTATAEDGRQSTIEVVRGCHQIQGDMLSPGPQWVKDALCELRTSDGRDVYLADEGDGEFRLAGSDTVYHRD